MPYQKNLWLILIFVFCIAFVSSVSVPAQGEDDTAVVQADTSQQKEYQPYKPPPASLPVRILITALAFVIVFFVPAFLIEKYTESPLPEIAPGTGGEEEDKLVREKLEAIRKFETRIESADNSILFGGRWNERKTRRMLRAIIAHPPREQELVETVNTTIRAYNKITRRQFCGDWCLLFVAPLWLCLFIFIGWGMGVPLFLAHVMYFFVTRAPIYHLLTHRKSGWDAQLNYLFDNADVVTGKTEYRYDRDGVADGFFGTKNVRKGQLHSTTTHRVGDAIPFMPFFIIVASMFMIPLIMVNLIRNYIIHWYGG